MRNSFSYRIFNLMIGLLVAAIDVLRKALLRLRGKPSRKICVVFAFHSVRNEHRDRFARQMDVLLRHAAPVSADIASLPNDRCHYAAITFDDGVANLIQNALPELQKRGIPATVFVVTEMLGENPRWEYRGANSTLQEKIMSETQLCALPTALITIGSHTATHPYLPALSMENLQRELEGSRLKLETMLNRPVKLFSSPYGEFDDRILDACRKAGYQRVFTTVPHLAFTNPQDFVTGRVGAAPTDWPIEFRLKLAGAYRWVPYAYALKRRIFSKNRNDVKEAVANREKTEASWSRSTLR
jgi:peptidoglycan/xylan/chitin deacetylase (PgdA/CDA1 family)